MKKCFLPFLLVVGYFGALFLWNQLKGPQTATITAATLNRAPWQWLRSQPPVHSSAVIADSDATNWQDFTPKQLTLKLEQGLEIPFNVTKVTKANGRTVMQARIDRDPSIPSTLDGAFMVSTSNDPNRWDARVVLAGAEYNVQVRNGETTIEQSPMSFKCGLEGNPALIHLPAQPNQANLVLAADVAADIVNGTAPANSKVQMNADGTVVFIVDVVFAYNPDALAERGDVKTIDADCSNIIEAGNVALQNSLVGNLQWRYVGLVETPTYTNTGSLYDEMTSMDLGALQSFVAATKATYGADQFQLLDGHYPSTDKNNAGGLGNLGGIYHQSVVRYPAQDGAGGWTFPGSLIHIHEMGHNFGLMHDRATCLWQGDGGQAGDGLYYYGYRFTDTTVGAPYNAANETGTIMGYEATRIPNFSNPNVTYHGYATGSAVGNPDAAYNALVLVNNAQNMSQSNAPVLPLIVQQPQSVTVNPGSSYDLFVVATGGNLTYQWYKNGTILAGVVDTFHMSRSATNSDQASYTVTVSNSLGSVTSSPAIVTVVGAPSTTTTSISTTTTIPPTTTTITTTTIPTTSITPTTTIDQGGGSSGGGGAPSDWFLGTLGLLILVRVVAQRRKLL